MDTQTAAEPSPACALSTALEPPQPESACAKPIAHLGIKGIQKVPQRIPSSWKRRAGEDSRLKERRTTDRTLGIFFKNAGVLAIIVNPFP